MGKHDGLVSIVDDDAALRRSLRNLLMSVGLRVETFESAEAFLESAHRENTGCARSADARNERPRPPEASGG